MRGRALQSGIGPGAQAGSPGGSGAETAGRRPVGAGHRREAAQRRGRGARGTDTGGPSAGAPLALPRVAAGKARRDPGRTEARLSGTRADTPAPPGAPRPLLPVPRPRPPAATPPAPRRAPAAPLVPRSSAGGRRDVPALDPALK